ncbi:hypothetical protein VYJ29_004435 [Yersinia enterocolitica]|jgi:hypothetical protein|uniref:hypothetical protein n=1 Tax=Enterobacter kobei TaxID=208224 RepID=UPI0028BC2233|nr:hypothetical protein [Yersinia enterocolitica]ELI8143059.1 hypothetical protein [Yersinia enterocolitica]ELI8192623.1 hypothetical protein [Yersinia enterocolitica]ELW8936310.1 hypothetical protein [Yersinia enterocolitica]ELW8944712.1 hypothetical protein [Yersinia enterocolitica]
MAKLSVEQRKERLKRELAKVETEERKLKKEKELKDLKIINSEILRYTKKDFDNFKKILGLLVLFESQNDEFRKAVFTSAEREINKRNSKG